MSIEEALELLGGMLRRGAGWTVSRLLVELGNSFCRKDCENIGRALGPSPAGCGPASGSSGLVAAPEGLGGSTLMWITRYSQPAMASSGNTVCDSQG